jgi:hypothetical protein
MLSRSGWKFLAASSIDISALILAYLSVIPNDIEQMKMVGGALIIVVGILIVRYILDYTPAIKYKDKGLC